MGRGWRAFTPPPALSQRGVLFQTARMAYETPAQRVVRCVPKH
jgi:hypothetical protein